MQCKYKIGDYCITWLINETLKILSKNQPINPSITVKYLGTPRTGIWPKPSVENTLRLSIIESRICIVKNHITVNRNTNPYKIVARIFFDGFNVSHSSG